MGAPPSNFRPHPCMWLRMGTPISNFRPHPCMWLRMGAPISNFSARLMRARHSQTQLRFVWGRLTLKFSAPCVPPAPPHCSKSGGANNMQDFNLHSTVFCSASVLLFVPGLSSVGTCQCTIKCDKTYCTALTAMVSSHACSSPTCPNHSSMVSHHACSSPRHPSTSDEPPC